MQRRTFLKYAGTTPFLVLPKLITANELHENKADVPSLNSTSMKIQRLAWAGIKIQVGNTTLFVDASVSENDSRLAAETEARHAIITHHHTDHYDIAALKTVLTEKSWLIYYQAVASLIDARAFRSQTAKLFEPVFIPRSGNDLMAVAVPAVDGFGHPQVSWVIDGGGKRVIHCGDTLWHGYWWDIARLYGPFDIAFMPINGFRQVSGRYTDSGIPMALTPGQAVAASKILGAKTICPIHYGRHDKNYFEVAEPESNFLKTAKEYGISTLVLKQNEWVNW